jgi:hypothetical protein
MLGFSWLKSEINKSCDTLYATPFIADTAPSCVPKSVNITSGARAKAGAAAQRQKINPKIRSTGKIKSADSR